MTASVHGCCERYSLDHGISSPLHETSELVEQNTPRLLTAQNSPAIFGFAARIVIIVPNVSGRPFENHFPLFTILILYTRDSAYSSKCASVVLKTAILASKVKIQFDQIINK